MPITLNTQRTFTVNHITYHYHSLEAAEKAGLKNIHRLPFSLKVLLENQLRHQNGKTVTQQDIEAFAHWLEKRQSHHEIAYRPVRVLMQDFTGVPAIVDLTAMRDAMKRLHGDPSQINPLCPVDLVIDHSVQVDHFGNDQAFQNNVQHEMQRNRERYALLKWGQQSFHHFRVVPPGTGICHQVNLEYLAKGVWSHSQDGQHYAYPDTLVGTDSHTTMINGLGVLGWGVGGIEAEAALLGQPISMLIPEVIGVRLEGCCREGITATDLVLTLTQLLRKKGVVGKFVEFYGPGLLMLPLADRATIANMAPEYGATCGFFPIDAETLRYLQLSGRDPQTIDLVKTYTQLQGLWHDTQTPEPYFTDTVVFDLSTVEPSLAGPKRPQDHVPLAQLAHVTEQTIAEAHRQTELQRAFRTITALDLHHGDVVIAAITSCTNTSNPSVMLAAGLLAKKAVEKGLKVKPWVKTSLAPGSKVVTDYLEKTRLMPYLQQLGFYLVGYGCTTCIGNSGPLAEDIAKTITDHDLIVCSVLSGNRNFEGRIHPLVKANWLASPPLVVALALAGTTRIDLSQEPLGKDPAGHPIFLRDIWPTSAEITSAMTQVSHTLFQQEYAAVFQGDDDWRAIENGSEKTYRWQPDSTYIQSPPFFDGMSAAITPIQNIHQARILALFGDSVTTDHISPAGSIKPDSPAGRYLIAQGVQPKDFNSYGARRGNHEVLLRGTFANIRIRNEILPGTEGGVTRHYPDKKELSIFDAAMQYKKEGIPLVIIAGEEYGTGSSRDWAAKGPLLLGVKAVIAQSFERIHRSNLVGMGILPLQLMDGVTRKTLRLQGDEMIDIEGLKDLQPGKTMALTLHRADQSRETVPVLCRIDTTNELEYYRHGGILQYVLRQMLGARKA
ncbi:MAG: aconitate hydratase 1 [Coxiella sp. RIFCSPHIGHO2_12_FULL_44_14]|nr:MAG: aconitate hydratase 1 [Coxiella sp. RIFCSPHIGHO2_12_FULL_44_14]